MIFVLHYVDKKKMHVFEHFPSIKYFSSTITMSLKAIIEGSFSKHVICPIYTCFVFILIFYSYFFITFFYLFIIIIIIYRAPPVTSVLWDNEFLESTSTMQLLLRGWQPDPEAIRWCWCQGIERFAGYTPCTHLFSHYDMNAVQGQPNETNLACWMNMCPIW